MEIEAERIITFDPQLCEVEYESRHMYVEITKSGETVLCKKSNGSYETKIDGKWTTIEGKSPLLKDGKLYFSGCSKLEVVDDGKIETIVNYPKLLTEHILNSVTVENGQLTTFDLIHTEGRATMHYLKTINTVPEVIDNICYWRKSDKLEEVKPITYKDKIFTLFCTKQGTLRIHLVGGGTITWKYDYDPFKLLNDNLIYYTHEGRLYLYQLNDVFDRLIEGKDLRDFDERPLLEIKFPDGYMFMNIASLEDSFIYIYLIKSETWFTPQANQVVKINITSKAKSAMSVQ